MDGVPQSDVEELAAANLCGDDRLICCCCKCGHLARKPVLLPCLHSICSECCHALADAATAAGRTASCPNCDEPVKDPLKAALHDSTLVAAKVRAAIFAAIDSSDGLPCDLCKTDGTVTNACTWCTECDQGLCDDCLSWHRKFNKHHAVTDLAGGDRRVPPTAARPHCCRHRSTTCDTYCVDCQRLCCSACRADCLNLLHRVQSLDDQRVSAQATELRSSIGEKLLLLHDHRLALSGEHNAKLRQELGKVHHKDIDALQTRKHAVLDALKAVEEGLEAAYEQREEELSDSMQQADKLLPRLQLAIAYCNAAVTAGDDCGLLDQQVVLCSRLASIESSAKQAQPPVADVKCSMLPVSKHPPGSGVHKAVLQLQGAVGQLFEFLGVQLPPGAAATSSALAVVPGGGEENQPKPLVEAARTVDGDSSAPGSTATSDLQQQVGTVPVVAESPAVQQQPPVKLQPSGHVQPTLQQQLPARSQEANDASRLASSAGSIASATAAATPASRLPANEITNDIAEEREQGDRSATAGAAAAGTSARLTDAGSQQPHAVNSSAGAAAAAGAAQGRTAAPSAHATTPDPQLPQVAATLPKAGTSGAPAAAGKPVSAGARSQWPGEVENQITDDVPDRPAGPSATGTQLPPAPADLRQQQDGSRKPAAPSLSSPTVTTGAAAAAGSQSGSESQPRQQQQQRSSGDVEGEPELYQASQATGRYNIRHDCRDVTLASNGSVLVAALKLGVLEYEASGREIGRWSPQATEDGREDTVSSLEALDSGGNGDVCRVAVGLVDSQSIVILNRGSADDNGSAEWTIAERFIMRAAPFRLSAYPGLLASAGAYESVTQETKGSHVVTHRSWSPGPYLDVMSVESGQSLFSEILGYSIQGLAVTPLLVAVLSNDTQRAAGGRQQYVVDAYSHPYGLRLWRSGWDSEAVDVCVSPTSGAVLYVVHQHAGRVIAVRARDGTYLGELLTEQTNGLQKEPFRLSLAQVGLQVTAVVMAATREIFLFPLS